MKTYLSMYLKGKIQSYRSLRKDNSPTLRSEHHNVIVVEGCGYTVHIINLAAAGYILQ